MPGSAAGFRGTLFRVLFGFRFDSLFRVWRHDAVDCGHGRQRQTTTTIRYPISIPDDPNCLFLAALIHNPRKSQSLFEFLDAARSLDRHTKTASIEYSTGSLNKEFELRLALTRPEAQTKIESHPG